LYPPGPGDVGNPFVQLHDFEPGIAPSGLFWTIPIDFSSIDVDPGIGQARLHAEDVAVTDYHNFFIAVALSEPPPPPLPSHVSFDVRWSGNGDRQKIRDETFGFTGQYVASPTTISFTASNDGGDVIYSSDPGGQYNPTVDQGGAGLPAVGHERNGVFFNDQ
jgi:hypothetical protein